MNQVKIRKRKTIPYQFGPRHKAYIRKCQYSTFNILEGAVRSGKTVDNIYAFAHELKTTPDKIHLATGSTMANAKLNIGDANGFGLEYIFRGQSHWGQYKGNDCLYISGPATNYKQKIVIFAGGAYSDSYMKIRGNSYGMWIATEINLHHDTTIKEAFNRQLAAKNRKIFWDMNPDHPKAPIYVDYIDKYARLNDEGKLLGGFNYEHFTIYENVNIPPERIAEIVSQYDDGSIWFIRDILGQRSIAEGLCYVKFSTKYAAYNNALAMARTPEDYEEAKKLNPYLVEKKTVLGWLKEGRLGSINVGVDFGGNGSGHTFVATTNLDGYHTLIALRSERHLGDEIDPVELARLFILFIQRILKDYGYVTYVYCDNAEQVLMRGLSAALAENLMGDIKLGNAIKARINDRINLKTKLDAQNRFLYIEEECESLAEALSMAVWDSKKIELERLDDGSSDIDSLDAFEYTYERDMKAYIERVGGV